MSLMDRILYDMNRVNLCLCLMKTCEGSGGAAPHTFPLGTRWRCVMSTPGPVWML
jgi:hypothetical protein